MQEKKIIHISTEKNYEGIVQNDTIENYDINYSEKKVTEAKKEE